MPVSTYKCSFVVSVLLFEIFSIFCEADVLCRVSNVITVFT